MSVKLALCFVLLGCQLANCKMKYMPNAIISVSQANNEFAFALHKTLPSEKNVVFSPWSITFSLGMIALGAEGKTFQEIQKSMFLEQVDPDNIHYGFKQLREHLSRYGRDYEMNMAATVLVQQRLNVSPVYKLKLQRYYDADIQDVDFAQHGKLVMNWANIWAALKTAGRIENILSSEPTPDTVMLLLSANYFKGKWEDPFNKNETKPSKFNNRDGTKTDIDMMYCIRNMSIYSGENLAIDAVHIPMKGDVSFVFIKPENPANMGMLEKNISTEFFQEIFNDFAEEPVELGLPKFKASGHMDLQKHLESLGIKNLFSPSEAELGGISNSGILSVDEVIHKAALAIDEEGAEAASVTLISIVSRTKAYKLHFNSPFIFLIRDVKSGAILFMGRISQL